MVSPRLSIPLGSTPSSALRRTLRGRSAVKPRPLSTISSTTRSTARPAKQPSTSATARFVVPLPTFKARSIHVTSRRAGQVKTFNLADIGEGITECEIIKWSVAPGSRIESFEPLCEVQSDKASVEITSPFDGVVKELLVPEGEIAKVGSGLCLIEVDTEGAEGVASSAPSASPESSNTPASSSSAPAPTQGEQRKRHPLDPANPNPSLSLGSRPPPRSGRPPFGGVRSKDMLNLDLNSQEKLQAALAAGSAPQFMPSGSSEVDVLATPQVRHFAKENGILDLSPLAPGSGKEGRIERSDVEAYLTRLAQPAAAQTSQAPPSTEKEVVVDLGRTRYNMWKAMEKSLEIPHFGYSTTLDITELDKLLPLLTASIPRHYLPDAVAAARRDPTQGMVNPSAIHPAPSPPPVPESGRFTKLTYLPFLLKTLSMAMMEWPLLRSSITPNPNPSGSGNGKPTLTIRPSSDIALALSTPTGLYTPTITATNTHSLYSLTSTLKHLAYLGRQTPCGLTPKEMPKKGGTLTVSNVGAIGQGESASPVLVPGGGVAIVAIGRAKWVWDVEDEFWSGKEGGSGGQRRLKLPVSWSADHRVVEGAELAAFVETWRSYVEKPARLLGECV